MNDHEELMKAAWENWHTGTGMDVDDMPPPNPSFKAGFNAGLVASHELHCKALIKISQQQSQILRLKDKLVRSILERKP